MPDRAFRREFNRHGSHESYWGRLRTFATTHRRWLFNLSIAVGFLSGLFFTLFGRFILHPQFATDGIKIWRISSGQLPDFSDQSFTPVALVYRFLGLGDSQLAAGIAGYALATIVILVALHRAGRNTASPLIAAYILATFSLAGVYLGQYSKDVFVLITALLLVLLPRTIWWELIALAWMALYAYFFRDYWWIVFVAYACYRIILIGQVRMRYLLLGGALASVGVGLAFTIVRGVDPNHFRTVVQPKLDDANTLIVPLVPFDQPAGGAIDVFLNYWLLFVPVLLPFTATIFHLAVTAGIAFAKVYPLVSARSAVRWPPEKTMDGTLVRRSLALIFALVVVQAVFEPDYGSSLRHFTPLMPLALTLMQVLRSGTERVGPATAWSWSGAPRAGLS